MRLDLSSIADTMELLGYLSPMLSSMEQCSRHLQGVVEVHGGQRDSEPKPEIEILHLEQTITCAN